MADQSRFVPWGAACRVRDGIYCYDSTCDACEDAFEKANCSDCGTSVDYIPHHCYICDAVLAGSVYPHGYCGTCNETRRELTTDGASCFEAWEGMLAAAIYYERNRWRGMNLQQRARVSRKWITHYADPDWHPYTKPRIES